MPPKKSKAIWRHFYGEKSQRRLQLIRQIYSLNEYFVELGKFSVFPSDRAKSPDFLLNPISC